MEYNDVGSYWLMSIPEYEKLLTDDGVGIKPEFAKKRIFLNCTTQEYIDYLQVVHDTKSRKDSGAIKGDSLITKLNNYFYNYIPCVISIDSDDLQTGKSIAGLQLSAMYNRDVDILRYVRWDFSDVSAMYRENYHKFLLEDEIQNSASRFISNTEIEIIQSLLTTFGDRNHILITTSGNYDILTLIKRFVRIRIHFVERGLADVYYPISNINSPTIRYKKIDRYRFLPIPIDLHTEYYTAKHKAVDPELAKREQKLRQLKRIKLSEDFSGNIDTLTDVKVDEFIKRITDREGREDVNRVKKLTSSPTGFSLSKIV